MAQKALSSQKNIASSSHFFPKLGIIKDESKRLLVKRNYFSDFQIQIRDDCRNHYSLD